MTKLGLHIKKPQLGTQIDVQAKNIHTAPKFFNISNSIFHILIGSFISTCTTVTLLIHFFYIFYYYKYTIYTFN